MSLSKQLRELERQRGMELEQLQRTYLATKRGIKRATSPSRLVKKHPWALVIGAAITGYLLAPRAMAQRPAAPPEQRRPRRSLWSNLQGQFRRLQRMFHGAHPATTGPATGPAGKDFLAEILAIFIAKLDIPSLVAKWVHTVSGKGSGHNGHARDGDALNVAVDDAGTIKPGEMNDVAGGA